MVWLLQIQPQLPNPKPLVRVLIGAASVGPNPGIVVVILVTLPGCASLWNLPTWIAEWWPDC